MAHNTPFRLAAQKALAESPPPFKVKPRATTKTRLPKYFDSHLHDSLVLKRVMPYPTLGEALLSVSHDALDEFLDGKEEIIASAGLRWDGYPKGTIDDEATIGFYYNTTTAPRVTKLANLLDRNTLPLDWSTSSPAHDEAVADGFLRFVEGYEPEVPSSLPVQRPGDGEKEPFQFAIVTWEFKTPGVATSYVEDEIGKMKGRSYSWYGCAGPHDPACSNRAGHSLGGVVISTSQIRSPDADPQKHFNSIRSSLASPSIGQPTYVRIREGPGYIPSDNDKAHHIIQQAWAQAVKNDATFLVLNMGQSEIIGYRHRKTQTLFLSQTYRVYEEHYTGIHVGLYLAAHRDAMERIRLLNAAHAEERKRVQAQPVLEDDRETVTVDETLAQWRRKPKEKAQSLLEQISIETLICNIPSILVKVMDDSVRMIPKEQWIRYDRLGDGSQFSHVRALEQKLSVHHRLEDGSEPESWPTEIWSLMLKKIPATSAITKGVWSHRAYLQEKSTSKEKKLQLVAKVAIGIAVSTLREQYINYWLLRAAGVPANALVACYTLFVSRDDGAAVLVGCRPGVPLWESTTTMDVHELFKSQLDLFHKHGFLRGEIKQEELYIESDSVAKIDGLEYIYLRGSDPEPLDVEQEQSDLAALLDEYVAHRKNSAGASSSVQPTASGSGSSHLAAVNSVDYAPVFKTEQNDDIGVDTDNELDAVMEEEEGLWAFSQGSEDLDAILLESVGHYDLPPVPSTVRRLKKRTYSNVSLNPLPNDSDRKGKRRAT